MRRALSDILAWLIIWSNGIIVSKFSRFTAQQLCKNYCPFQSLAISFLWTKFLYFATKAGSWGIPIKLSQLYEGPWGRLIARSWHLRIIGERDLYFGWNLNFCRHKEQMMHEQHYRLQVASITRASRTSQGKGWSQTYYENKLWFMRASNIAKQSLTKHVYCSKT